MEKLKQLNISFIGVWLFFLPCMVLSAAEDDFVDHDLIVHLHIEKKPYFQCEEIPAKLSISNIGRKAIIIPAIMQQKWFWLNFEIKDEEGEIKKYQGPIYKIEGRDDIVTLHPGYELSKYLLITCEDYDIRNKGSYSIQAIYGKGPSGKKTIGPLLSNTEKFKVW